MFSRKLLAAAALACLGATSAQAVALAANGQWVPLDVAPELALDGGLGWIDITTGQSLSFSFVVPVGKLGSLTIVDGGFAGDQLFSSIALPNGFTNFDFGSTPVNSYPSSLGLDFDAAIANPNYSRSVILLQPGTYEVFGRLFASALDGAGQPINATVGGIKLTLVPEPATVLSMLAGLGLLAGALRRRAV
jgi:PEP-CTERM motif